VQEDYSLYYAPEIHSGNEYSKACDIWSLGIVFYEICTHEVPFKSKMEILNRKEMPSIDIVTNDLNSIIKK
jgi:serine/threonine protein kinase